MIKNVLESFLQLGFVAVLIALLMNRNDKKSYQLLVLFCAYFMVNQILLLLPTHFEAFDLFKSNWNWSGKIYAIIGSIFFYYLFRHHFKNNDYLKVKQTPSSITNNIILVVFIGTASFIAGLYLFSTKEFNLETLAFQITMPGIDEEIAYRGIMIGILLTLFKSDGVTKPPIKQSAIWVTAILFALVHTLRIESLSSFKITNNWSFFMQSTLMGYIMGWMTLKSKSILMPMIAHNAANFFRNIAMMLK